MYIYYMLRLKKAYIRFLQIGLILPVLILLPLSTLYIITVPNSQWLFIDGEYLLIRFTKSVRNFFCKGDYAKALVINYDICTD